jgi:hypothetical protein
MPAPAEAIPAQFSFVIGFTSRIIKIPLQDGTGVAADLERAIRQRNPGGLSSCPVIPNGVQ